MIQSLWKASAINVSMDLPPNVECNFNPHPLGEHIGKNWPWPFPEQMKVIVDINGANKYPPDDSMNLKQMENTWFITHRSIGLNIATFYILNSSNIAEFATKNTHSLWANLKMHTSVIKFSSNRQWKND